MSLQSNVTIALGVSFSYSGLSRVQPALRAGKQQPPLQHPQRKGTTLLLVLSHKGIITAKWFMLKSS